MRDRHHSHGCGERHHHHEEHEEQGWGEGRGRHGPPWARHGHGRGGPFGGPGHGPFWFGRGRGPGRGPFGPFGPFGDGPGGDDPFGGGGPPRRQRRGDIKFALLELLAEQPRHGYDLIKELERRFGGFYRPSPGSVYPTLQLLEDEGHLTSSTVDGKRVYTITDSGRRILEERRPTHPGFGHHGPPMGREELGELRESVGALVGVVMQAARHGTPEQVRSIKATLDRARREIYASMAEPGGETTEA